MEAAVTPAAEATVAAVAAAEAVPWRVRRRPVRGPRLPQLDRTLRRRGPALQASLFLVVRTDRMDTATRAAAAHTPALEGLPSPARAAQQSPVPAESRSPVLVA